MPHPQANAKCDKNSVDLRQSGETSSLTENAPHVAILMATFNGEAFLAEQLDSIATQTHSNWTLWASDDGSTDGTLKLLAKYRHEWGHDRLQIVHGPRRGVASNFLSMIGLPAIPVAYHAFADQDDIWEAGKLARALECLRVLPDDKPALYCGRTRLIDSTGYATGMSWLFPEAPSFRNALAQNIGGGNTMVLSPATVELVRQACPELEVLLHDWWLYLLTTGVGGNVVYDPAPQLRYRQHDTNIVGSNLGLTARIHRAMAITRGTLRTWNDRNLQSLDTIKPYLTDDSRYVLREFEQARTGSLLSRLLHLRRSGVHRQQLSGNIGLFLATVFGSL